MRLTSQRPEPGHFWIRSTPTPWPGPDGLWVDLAAGGLGRTSAQRPADLEPLEGTAPEDVLYLPPVPDSLSDARDKIASETLERGVPVLAQILPGQPEPPAGCRVVVDLSGDLFAGVAPRLSSSPTASSPTGSGAVWPLVSGLTDGPELVGAGLENLVQSGIREVQGLALNLSPADRRRLAELGDETAFHRIFHGEPPSEREFAAAAAVHGFKPLSDRPLPADWRPDRANRRLAGELALVGELWLRVGRTEATGQAFYRASRWVDNETHNLDRLCREGNLGVVSWLDGSSRQVIRESVVEGCSTLRRELEEEYVRA